MKNDFKFTPFPVEYNVATWYTFKFFLIFWFKKPFTLSPINFTRGHNFKAPCFQITSFDHWNSLRLMPSQPRGIFRRFPGVPETPSEIWTDGFNYSSNIRLLIWQHKYKIGIGQNNTTILRTITNIDSLE